MNDKQLTLNAPGAKPSMPQAKAQSTQMEMFLSKNTIHKGHTEASQVTSLWLPSNYLKEKSQISVVHTGYYPQHVQCRNLDM